MNFRMLTYVSISIVLSRLMVGTAIIEVDDSKLVARDAHQAGLHAFEKRDLSAAVRQFTKAIELDPERIATYDRRGDAYLMLGEFKKAIADFDAVIKRDPEHDAHHWRRGIALYYARDYKAGAAQFDRHKAVNPQDVENAFWHYLCNVQVIGKEKAQAQLIGVERDGRVPMKEVMQLLAGKATVNQVIARAEQETKAGNATSAQFYAHLYVALWYESQGNADRCKEHLRKAVKDFKVNHYMWDVANIHLKLMK